MPLCPQITNTPITVTQTADFTVSSVTPITVATSTQVNQAQSTATTALANAAIAYSAAIGSLQPSANTIVNASNQMTAIAANGITVYSGSSPSSGARVVLNSTGLAGFNSGGSATFSVSATTGAAVFSGSITGSAITGSTLNISGNCIIDASGFLTATGATITGAITATSGSFTGSITSTSGTLGGFTIGAAALTGSGGFTLSSTGQIDGGSGNTIFYGKANIGGGTAGSENLIVTGNSNLNGTLITSGATTVQGVFTAVDAGVNTNTNTPNAWLSTGGVLRRSTSSSARYKENIVDLLSVPELDPKKLLALPVRAFTYKEDYLSAADDRYQQMFPGFISEEVDAIYPMAADYENGEIESWNDRMIVPALLSLVQELYKRVEELEAK
jgi:hypothetical protein